MKTILFTQPNSSLVQKLENEGRQYILAKDPIKTLKAMKKLQRRADYTILGDEESSKYLDLAKKMGYQEFKEENKDRFFVETLTMLGEGYNKRVEAELKRVEEDYKIKFDILSKDQEQRLKMSSEQQKATEDEYRLKIAEAEKAKESIKLIKQKIKQQIYG